MSIGTLKAASDGSSACRYARRSSALAEPEAQRTAAARAWVARAALTPVESKRSRSSGGGSQLGSRSKSCAVSSHSCRTQSTFAPLAAASAASCSTARAARIAREKGARAGQSV
eukprot:scaffold239407_cov28-Tisochrysis_lutea.AAC.1